MHSFFPLPSSTSARTRCNDVYHPFILIKHRAVRGLSKCCQQRNALTDVNLRLACPIYLYYIKSPSSSCTWGEWLSRVCTSEWKHWGSSETRRVWDCESFPEDQRGKKSYFSVHDRVQGNIFLDRGSLSFFLPQVRWQMMSKYIDFWEKKIGFLYQRPGIQTGAVWRQSLAFGHPSKLLPLWRSVAMCQDGEMAKAVNEWTSDALWALMGGLISNASMNAAWKTWWCGFLFLFLFFSKIGRDSV